ncbi:MAG: peptidylprolyl isomerase [Thermoplasmata archaeon]|nr:peptidylprolyl isomerase [Thermoplasmata archaeon]
MARRKKIGELRDTEVECGYCDAIIPEDAVRCPNCGKLFSAAKKLAVFAIVVIIVIAGMSYFAYTAYFTGQQAAINDLDPINPDGTTPPPATGGKTIVFELKEADVPNTCNNFKNYVNDQYFDGLIFHRIIDGFMIQGGGMNPDMTPKTATYPPIALEISPTLRHIDGAVAMARTTDPNTATSQFYICDGAQASLDDQYAVFGQVTSGMDVVRAISAVATDKANGDVPLSPVVILSARLSTIGGKNYVTMVVDF